MKKAILLFITCIQAALFLAASPQHVRPHKIERRAAFDIGSGQIKLQISDVDVTINKIMNVLLIENYKIPFREDLVKSLDGRFSNDIQNKAVEALSQLMDKAKVFHPDAYHAIATEPFRLARNGWALGERIEKETGLPVTIVSQEEEGILGFITAINTSNVDCEKAVVWDCGGGSFQITTMCGEEYSIYQSKLGKVPFKNALLEIQGKEIENKTSPNPISQSEAMSAIQYVKKSIDTIPSPLYQKLHESDVIVLGIGLNPMWGFKHSKCYNKEQILEEIERHLDLDDHSIIGMDLITPDNADAAKYVVSNLILAYGVMEAFDIGQVHYVGTQGANAIGVLLFSKYWYD